MTIKLLFFILLTVFSAEPLTYTYLGKGLNLFKKPALKDGKRYHIQRSPRIIHGTEVPPLSYSFQVALIFYTQFNPDTPPLSGLCGGTVISKTCVLTAAHCVSRADMIMVLFGAHDIDLREEPSRLIVEAEVWISHEDFDPAGKGNDIAVVKLKTEVEFKIRISPVKLPSGQIAVNDKAGLLLGWGDTEEGVSGGPLRSGNVKVRESCEMGITSQPGTTVCVFGEGPTRPCFGDSGGPLLVDGVQVGVASFGTANCSEGYPAVFTRVDKYLEWIERNGGATDEVILAMTVCCLLLHVLF